MNEYCAMFIFCNKNYYTKNKSIGYTLNIRITHLNTLMLMVTLKAHCSNNIDDNVSLIRPLSLLPLETIAQQ